MDSVNVTNVSLSFNLTENNSSTIVLTCFATANPPPTIYWEGPHTNMSNILKLNVTREISGQYKCQAINTMNFTDQNPKTGQSEQSYNIDVLYPPEVQELKNQVVVENDSVNIRCSMYEGKTTVQTVSWWKSLTMISKNSVIEIRNLNRTHHGNYDCVLNFTMVPTYGVPKTDFRNKSFLLDVLYPPENVTASLEIGTVRNDTIVNTLTVIENTSLTLVLNCSASGNPTNISYSWIGPQNSSSAILKINVSRQFNGNYICQTKNSKLLTNGTHFNGFHEKRYIIGILYPPEIKNLENFTVIEGKNYSVKCVKKDGLTNFTSVKWLRSNGTEEISNSLNIDNVNRNNAGKYVCFLNYEMFPTYGEPKTGSSNTSFFLEVLYKASISNFFINGTVQSINMTVNESETVLMMCILDSNPNSTMQITFENGKKSYKENTKRLEYFISRSNCTDTGIYVCSGYNEVNEKGQMSSKEVRIYVNYSMQGDGGNKVESPSITGPAVGGAVGGIAAILVSIAVVYVIKKRGIPKMPHEDIHPPVYQNMNFAKDVKQHKPLPSLPTEDVHEIPERQQHHIHDDRPETNTMGLKTQKKPGEVKHYPEYENMNLKTYAKQHKRIPPIPTEKVYEVHDQQNQVHHVEDSEDQSCPTAIELLPVINKISLSDLLSYVTSKTSEDYVHEFMKFPLGIMDSIPYSFARKPQNAPMNRYQGIYPYDHSRVVIPTEPDFFINANYIDGHSKGKAYIASLGPTVKHTLGFQTFWKMVWNEKSDVIVMLTNLQEPSGMKCEKYWADYGTTREVGDFTIKSVTEEVAAEYTVRTFNVSKKGESRPVTQLHYTAWPDKKVPEDVTSLIEFWQRVKAAPTRSLGPLVVHCSAGIGRTGTYIALDRLFEEGKTTDSVNVFDCVMSMRQQRVNMVQTQDQYVYLHQALVYCLVFDTEPVTAENIEEYVKTTSHNVYIKLFEQLKQSVEVESTYETEARTRNCDDDERNRTQADIPCDAHRIRLFLDKESDESDYINAVYLNSFKRLGYFIIAQSPLPNTLDDFMSMLYQENCCCIVSLDDYQQKGKNNAAYLPAENQHATYGTCTLSSTMLDSNPAYSVRKLKIGHSSRYEKGMKIAHHFEYTGWKHDERIPKDVNMFVEFVQEVEEYATQLADEHSHVLVHCLTGSGRSGLFCAVSNLIQKMGQDRQVSVVNTLRQVRARRKTAIRNTEQLKFCYQSVYAFVKNYKV